MPSDPIFDDAPKLDRLIRRGDLHHYAGLGRTQIAVKIAAGEFPAPVPLSDSGRAVAWLESDLVAWQQRRVAARNRGIVHAAKQPEISPGKANTPGPTQTQSRA